MNWRRSGWSIVPIIAVVLALYLLLASRCAQAFTPCHPDIRVRLTLIESPLPHAECAQIAAEHGAVGAALLMLVSPNPACSVWGAGRGWIVAWPGVPDWVIGREVRHAIWGEQYMVPGLPVFGECAK